MPTHAQVLAIAFDLFKNSYGGRWAGADPDIWAMLLEKAQPEEIQVAAKKWCQEHDWPPTPKDLLAAVPRLCRCGRCSPCQAAAYQRAVGHVERGALGASLEPSKLLVDSGASQTPSSGGQRRLAP